MIIKSKRHPDRKTPVEMSMDAGCFYAPYIPAFPIENPDRQVFHCDLGDMSPKRAGEIMRDLIEISGSTQGRKFENLWGDWGTGQEQAFLTQEDFVFPATTSGRGSKVEELPGSTSTLDEILMSYFQTGAVSRKYMMDHFGLDVGTE